MPTHAHGFWVGMGEMLLVMLQILNSMGGHGWTWVVVDGCGVGLGMGMNSKEMLGSSGHHLSLSRRCLCGLEIQ